jgi:hypothetical protein
VSEQVVRYYVTPIGVGWCVCDRQGIKPGEIVYIGEHEEEAEAALKRIQAEEESA